MRYSSLIIAMCGVIALSAWHTAQAEITFGDNPAPSSPPVHIEHSKIDQTSRIVNTAKQIGASAGNEQNTVGALKLRGATLKKSTVINASDNQQSRSLAVGKGAQTHSGTLTID